MDTGEKVLTAEKGSNVDYHGNVLYLDEERLKAKERPLQRLYQNKKNGLGVKNFILDHLSAHDWNWGLVLSAFRLILKKSIWMKQSEGKAKFYKKAMLFTPDEERSTYGVVLNLNVDLDDKIQSATIPIDLVKKALKNAKYIGGMKKCLCRDAGDCKDYPKDIACLFLSSTGRTVVDHGLAEELTYEEACARVDKAAELGFCCQSLWVEIEQFIWGFHNDQLDHFCEICFCCPCCCVAFNLSKNASREVKSRFSPSGFTAVADKRACVSCGACAAVCEQEAITYDADGKICINQDYCVGCGHCKSKCESGVVKIRQTMPLREDIHDYFLKEARIDLKMYE